MTVVATLASLHRYPVKSLQGERMEVAALDREGLQRDRRFAFRDLDTGRIASAKQPRPWRALLDLSAHTADGEVVIRTPAGVELLVADPTVCELVRATTGRRVAVIEARAGHLGSYDSTWPDVDGVTLFGRREFSMALDTDAVRFVDVAGLHVITTATLAQIEEASPGSSADPGRFRPNLVLDTGDLPPSFLEDAWVGQELRIGDTVRIRITTNAPRCVMTTVAQPGLDHDPGILRAAATNRRAFDVGTLACAGAYAEVVTPGLVRVGDHVSLG